MSSNRKIDPDTFYNNKVSWAFGTPGTCKGADPKPPQKNLGGNHVE